MDTQTTLKEVLIEFQGLIRVYKDNSVQRLWNSPYVAPTKDTLVSSKDITISPSTGLTARLHLPSNILTQPGTKLPILVYFHGGGFCTESAFSTYTSPYVDMLSSHAQVLVVSVEYRLAPEHLLPVAYEDCWEALQWVVSGSGSDSWLSEFGDVGALFIGGDSSGGNIVHNIAMRAGNESLDHGVKILGAFISQGFFLDEKIEELEIGYKIWDFVYPNAPGGRNSPMINPMGSGAPSMASLGCSKVLVVVAGNDIMRGSGIRYYNAIKDGGFEGQVEFFEVEGEGHGFHVFNPHSANAKLLFQRVASFMRKLITHTCKSSDETVAPRLTTLMT